MLFDSFSFLVEEDITARDTNVKMRPAIIWSVVFAFESRNWLQSESGLLARALHCR
jgi:hypothetical protein